MSGLVLAAVNFGAWGLVHWAIAVVVVIGEIIARSQEILAQLG